MLKKERLEYILNLISKDNRVYVSSLSNDLGVSDDTLRRDLLELDSQGLLTKVHGGAIAKSGISIQFTDRINIAVDKKRQMALKVIPLFKNGDVILLDGGTSNLEVVRQLPDDLELTIFTNSFPVINELFNHPNVESNFLGGKVFVSSQVSLGIDVYHALQSINPDWVLVGVSDVHPEKGLTCPDREEALIKRSMIDRGNKRIILADSHKLNTARTYHVASLEEIDYVVTEDNKVDYIKNNWPQYSYEVI